MPEARLALSKDKRLGETADYIRELAKDEAERPVERWFFSKWLQKVPKARSSRAASASMQEARVNDAATSENADVSLQQLFEPASLAGNATPKFFSGDNPIVVTLGALMGFGIFAAAARENGALAADAAVVCVGLIFGLTRLQLK